MPRTTIPWGDGSGGNIYLDYTAPSGDQNIAVSSDANGGAARSKTIVFSASGVSPVILTVSQAAGSLIVPIYDGVFPAYSEVARGFVWTLPNSYRRINGIVYDGAVWYDTAMRLRGSDTIRISFKASKACNVFGCYTTADAQDNYSLYITTSSNGKYMRYNGGTYNSNFATNTRYDVTITPTGTSGLRVDSSWTAQSFTTASDMLIGLTSVNATSAKFTGTMYGEIEVEGRAFFIPVVRIADGAVGYYDVFRELFLTNQGGGTPIELV